MSQQSGLTPSEHLRTYGRVHIVGAEPVGLFLTALLQPMEGFSVRLYEKRTEYTRTRMVKLAPYLMADSVASSRRFFTNGRWGSPRSTRLSAPSVI
jgi:hypothetical protein